MINTNNSYIWEFDKTFRVNYINFVGPRPFKSIDDFGLTQYTCVTMTKDSMSSGWDEIDCMQERNFICQKSAASVVTSCKPKPKDYTWVIASPLIPFGVVLCISLCCFSCICDFGKYLLGGCTGHACCRVILMKNGRFKGPAKDSIVKDNSGEGCCRKRQTPIVPFV